MLVSRRVGVFSMCAQSPFQTGITDCRHEQRPRLVVDCGLDHHMTHPRVYILYKNFSISLFCNFDPRN